MLVGWSSDCRSKLQNIEDTERAKAMLLEKRRQAASYANQITRELTGGDWREGRASDEIVMDRFKRREMQFWGGRGRGRR